jgi:hypothetical protein
MERYGNTTELMKAIGGALHDADGPRIMLLLQQCVKFDDPLLLPVIAQALFLGGGGRNREVNACARHVLGSMKCFDVWTRNSLSRLQKDIFSQPGHPERLAARIGQFVESIYETFERQRHHGLVDPLLDANAQTLFEILIAATEAKTVARADCRPMHPVAQALNVGSVSYNGRTYLNLIFEVVLPTVGVLIAGSTGSSVDAKTIFAPLQIYSVQRMLKLLSLWGLFDDGDEQRDQPEEASLLASLDMAERTRRRRGILSNYLAPYQSSHDFESFDHLLLKKRIDTNNQVLINYYKSSGSVRKFAMYIDIIGTGAPSEYSEYGRAGFLRSLVDEGFFDPDAESIVVERGRLWIHGAEPDAPEQTDDRVRLDFTARVIFVLDLLDLRAEFPKVVPGAVAAGALDGYITSKPVLHQLIGRANAGASAQEKVRILQILGSLHDSWKSLQAAGLLYPVIAALALFTGEVRMPTGPGARSGKYRLVKADPGLQGFLAFHAARYLWAFFEKCEQSCFALLDAIGLCSSGARLSSLARRLLVQSHTHQGARQTARRRHLENPLAGIDFHRVDDAAALAIFGLPIALAPADEADALGEPMMFGYFSCREEGDVSWPALADAASRLPGAYFAYCLLPAFVEDGTESSYSQRLAGLLAADDSNRAIDWAKLIERALPEFSSGLKLYGAKPGEELRALLQGALSGVALLVESSWIAEEQRNSCRSLAGSWLRAAFCETACKSFQIPGVNSVQ